MDINNTTSLGKVKIVMLKGERGETGHGALVANSVADMVDITQIYVYTGNENGYTFGNWYYWDGTAWTSGGAYNAVVVETDKTLSVEDMAADAETVGKAIYNGRTHSKNLPRVTTLYTDFYNISTFTEMPAWTVCSTLGSQILAKSANTVFAAIDAAKLYIIEKLETLNNDKSKFAVFYHITNIDKTQVWTGYVPYTSVGTAINDTDIRWKRLQDINEYSPAAVARDAQNALDDADEEWLMTDFAQLDHWWGADGDIMPNSQSKHSEFIYVRPGQKLYGAYFGNNPPQACGGVFYDANMQLVKPLLYQYSGISSPDAVPYTYYTADVAPTVNLTYATLWEITVPANAYYVSINMRGATTVAGGVQSLSTLPIIGATGTGNRIWRRDDPLRSIKRGKRLYIIGQSGISIDRAMRPYQEYATDPNRSQNDDPTSKPVVGFQEYIVPYYDAGKVISLGFSGIGYRNDGTNPSIYNLINTNAYENHDVFPLNDADEVLLCMGTNNANYIEGGVNTIGAYDSYDETKMMGAINLLIDKIYANNNGHAVVIYVETYHNKWPQNGTTEYAALTDAQKAEADEEYEKYSYLNQQIRLLAEFRNLVLIDREKTNGINCDNHKYLSYDVYKFPPYGTHFNNEGNRLRGYTILRGLCGIG